MKLVIYTPTGRLIKTDIKKIIVETHAGYYTLLPHHVDFAAALKTGIADFVEESGKERYAACHHGIVVKKGDMVSISVQNAVISDTLEELSKVVQKEFKDVEERRKEFNTAMARLELGLIRGFGKINTGVVNDAI